MRSAKLTLTTCLATALLGGSSLFAQDAKPAPPPAPEAVPQASAADVTLFLTALSFGQYQPAYIDMFSAPMKGSPDNPLPMAGVTTALVEPGSPCVEPAIPDPNWKPANTADYWGHKFADRHIDYPKAEQQTYDDLMAQYRALCHTQWNLVPLVEKHQPAILLPVPKPEPVCAPDDQACENRSHRVQVFGSISTVVFSSSHNFALFFFRINAGGLSDQGMWMVVQKTADGWIQRTDWGNSVTLHD